MRKNETILTPIFRYIMKLLNDFPNDMESVIRCAENIKNRLSERKTQEMGDFKEIVILLKESITVFDLYKVSQDECLNILNNRISEVQSKKCNLCHFCYNCKSYYWQEVRELLFGVPKEFQNQEYYIPLRKLPVRISRHLEPSVSMADMYYTKARRNDSKTHVNKLVLLKGMSSSTPAMLNSIFETETFVGGGFYLNWKGLGIVIDPGYHFVHNMHQYGLTVFDVDVVIITHEHIDHNVDMRVLDDLFHVMARYKGAEHKVKWYMDAVTFELAETLQRREAGFLADRNELICVKCEFGNQNIQLNHSIELEMFATQHIPNAGNTQTGFSRHTFGCRFVFKDEADTRIVVYTSDTRYFEKLADSLRDANILIANISGIYEDDYMLVKQKEKHLGYFGCYNLIKSNYIQCNSYPKLYFLSEFWDGDIRYDVTAQLQDDLSKLGLNDIRVLPAEVGMMVDIKNMKICCMECGKYTNKYIVKQSRNTFGRISILCAECYY